MKNHYSVEDWDRNHPASMVLTDTYKVSPPSSLWFKKVAGSPAHARILSRDGETQNIAEGRIVCFLLGYTADFQAGFLFRNQATLGTADRENCFQLYIDSAHWSLTLFIEGVAEWSIDTDGDFPTEEWLKIRASWWNGYSENGVEALAVMVERYIAGEWVQQGDIAYDEDNHWKDSEINRCGHACFLRDPNHVYVDDTEIWKRTE